MEMEEGRVIGHSALSIVSAGSRTSGAVVHDQVVDLMRGRLPSETKESVMNSFGISAATWLKIKRGQPIRRSTAENLLMRLARF